MGDTGDDFRAMRKDTNERKAVRLSANVAELIKANIGAVEQSLNVWRLVISAGIVMYYPGTNTWQHKARIRHGDVKSFINWIRKTQAMTPLPEQPTAKG